MQDNLELMKDIIGSFLKDGKEKLVEWFLNSGIEEEAGIQVSSLPYEERKAGMDTGTIHRFLYCNRPLQI